MKGLQKVVNALWQFLREVFGENDYARYRAHVLSRGAQPMTPEALYLSKLQSKYSRPNRCC